MHSGLVTKASYQFTEHAVGTGVTFFTSAEVDLEKLFTPEQVIEADQFLEDICAGIELGCSNVVDLEEFSTVLQSDDLELAPQIWEKFRTVVEVCRKNKAVRIVFL